MRGEVVPDGWGRSNLGDLVREDRPICYGVLKPGDYHGSGVPMVRIVDLVNDEVNEAGLFRIGNTLDHLFARSRLEGGEVLLSIQGTIGRVAIASQRLNKANISRTIARIHLGPEGFPAFVRHWMLSSMGQRAFDDNVVGTTRSSLNIGALRRIRIPSPPLPEQRRIAEILDTLDEAIRKTEQVIAKLQQMKQGLLHDLLTRGIDEHGELRPPPEEAAGLYKDSPLGRIPSGWTAGTLGEVVTFQGGFGFPERFQGLASGELPFFKVSDQSNPGNERYLKAANHYVSRATASRQGWHPIAAGGVAFAKVGAALLLNRRRILVADSLVDNNMMVAVASASVDGIWLYWWLHLVDFAVLVQSGALPSVNQGQLASLPVALPPVEEQRSIRTILDEYDGRTDDELGGLAKLRTLKHGLMDDLLTGRVRTLPTEATA